MPQVYTNKNNEEELVEEVNEIHQLHILFVDIVVPNSSHCDQVIPSAKEQVENKKKIETHILKTDAVVNPGRVVVNMKYASVAHRAVSCTYRFYIHAFAASRYPRC
jgi:hypothetical protein